jgi:hypothetical protein
LNNLNENICGRCGRERKENEHFPFHSRIVTPTYLCLKCEEKWINSIKRNALGSKPDDDWKEAFDKFLESGIGKIQVQFT